MRSIEIVRSWKDEDFFGSLSDAERAFLPPNPVGFVELTDEDLLTIEGGTESAWGCLIVGTVFIASAIYSAVSAHTSDCKCSL